MLDAALSSGVIAITSSVSFAEFESHPYDVRHKCAHAITVIGAIAVQVSKVTEKESLTACPFAKTAKSHSTTFGRGVKVRAVDADTGSIAITLWKQHAIVSLPPIIETGESDFGEIPVVSCAIIADAACASRCVADWDSRNLKHYVWM